MVSSNLNKLVLPDGTFMSEFALSGSVSGFTASGGITNYVTKWLTSNVLGNSVFITSADALYPDASSDYDLGTVDYFYDSIYLKKIHIGNVSSQLTFDTGNIVLNIATSKKLQIVHF